MESKEVCMLAKLKEKQEIKEVSQGYGKGVLEIMSIYWSYYKNYTNKFCQA